MMDFLKQFPFVTKEEYLWKWTVPQIRLANIDTTHIVYLDEKKSKKMKGRLFDGTNLGDDKGVLHL